MEKDLDIISLDYEEAKKVSILFKSLSILLTLRFIFSPLSEFIDVFRKSLPHFWCCQPGFCNLNSYSYYFI
jgi:hypothetical protein